MAVDLVQRVLSHMLQLIAQADAAESALVAENDIRLCYLHDAWQLRRCAVCYHSRVVFPHGLVAVRGKVWRCQVLGFLITGERCTFGGDVVHAKLNSHEHVDMVSNVHDNNDGTYELAIEVQAVGRFCVDIFINGKRIVKSQFYLNVKEGRDYRAISSQNAEVVGGHGVDIGRFVYPKGIAVVRDMDGPDKLLVTDTVGDRIHIFANEPNIQIRNVIGPAEAEPLMRPGNLAVSYMSNRHIWVSEMLSQRVKCLTLEGEHLTSIHVQQPSGVAVLLTGEIAVADTLTNSVMIFDTAGILQRSIGDGILSYPCGLGVLHDGDLAVCDYGNHRVVIFNIAATTFRTIGSNNQMRGPHGLCVTAEGHIVVAESRRHCISIWTSLGERIHRFGQMGVVPGCLSWPTDVAVLSDGRIAVVDYNNHRVQLF